MKPAKPFLKWVGGKRFGAPEIVSHFPNKINTYYEPMVGSGAVFFELAKSRIIKKAVLADINQELIHAYTLIKENPQELLKLLRALRGKHMKMLSAGTAKSLYYKMRDLNIAELPPDKIAARLIYLNKTCYNGLYRVNKKGKFNSPMGDQKNPAICETENILQVSTLLNRVDASIISLDYREALAQCGVPPKPGDVVYFDPPYWQKDKNSFVAYTKNQFHTDDHVRLSKFCRKLAQNGLFVAVSNVDVPAVRDLYSDFDFVQIETPRRISGDVHTRGSETELLILSRN